MITQWDRPASVLSLCFFLLVSGHVKCFSTPSSWSQRTASNHRPPSHHDVRLVGNENELDSSRTFTGEGTSQLSRGAFLTLVGSAALVTATTPKNADAKTTSAEPNKQIRTNPSLLLTGNEATQESISGFIAGGSLTITKTIVKYPLDTATVRLQMPGTDFSIRDPIRLLEGAYRGVFAPLLWNVPGGAIFFAIKDATKSALRESGLPKWATTSLAVAAAQVPYWLVRNPSEVVKTRQQAGVNGYGEGVSSLDAFRLVLDQARANNRTGLDSFYSGYWENILYAYPADVIKFVCYDTITQGKKNLPPLDGAVAGAASTAVAQLSTTPLDVVRNRVMALGDQSSDEKPSYINSLVKLSKEEGIEGLFAGASPRVGKAIVSGAIQFATYEETKQKLNAFFLNR
jgi:hypothetical protein